MYFQYFGVSCAFVCLRVKVYAICSVYWCVLLTYTFKTSVCCHSISLATFQRNIICTFQTLQLNIPPMITFNKTSLQILNHLPNIFEEEGLKHKINKWSIRIQDFSNLQTLIFVLSFNTSKIKYIYEKCYSGHLH